MLRLIDSTQLNIWFVSSRRDAQGLLPHLIRRLMLGTNRLESFTELRIPVRDEVGRPGYDGRVCFDGKHPFVPTGQSVWEMSCGDPLTKANANYASRSKDPGDINPAATVFVFVTPHRWDGKENWIVARKTEKIWKDVRVVDDVDLALWLETSIAVGRWLAREIACPLTI